MLMYLNKEDFRKEKADLGFERVRGFNHQAYRAKLLKTLN